MHYDVKTPAEYMDVLDKDWRLDKLEELRALIKSKAPEMSEGIKYSMLSYGDENDAIFLLNVQRQYVSLYVGDVRKIDPTGELLAGLNVGKGCIRLTKSKVIANTKLDQFIDTAVDLWKKGADMGC